MGRLDHCRALVVRLLSFWAAILLSFCAIGTASAQDAVTPSDRVRRNVVVRAEPTTDSAALDRLVPGDQVQLGGEEPGWYRIRLPDGREGFVSKAWTVLIEGPDAAAGGAFRVHVIDVGTGLAVFAEGPGFTLLYDAGSQDDLADGPENRVVAYIRGVRPNVRVLDHVILSHPHKDHLELMPDVFDAFEVRNVWESGRVNRTVGYCRFLRKVAAEPGVLYHDALASNAVRTVTFTGSSCNGDVNVAQAAQMTGAPVSLGAGARMSVLYRDAHPYSDPNGNSVVVRLDLGGRRVLLTGDAEGGDREPTSTPPRPNSIEGRLLVCCRSDLAADVLVVGHHGSLTSSRDAFLDAVGADFYAVSSGPQAYRGVVLPDREVIDELASRGRVFRTDVDDDACEVATAKIGPDADESPGGCSNILFEISGTGIIASYASLAD
ncbi:MBL fold metallo-hydrolase [Brevundimonas sp.]|uniref:MBL fold metallo-hydrolase n=1 Tax=Brevundimonas sp. TaxID=1871086 RepID=UPI002D4C7AF0|nr:MBL fold metallo-hydrolase [Brevundimonas sp.]HYC99553.1 MBL fold metallo-hydrolase [Brevundimonas sp.]